MNTIPMIKGAQLQANTCGRTACALDAAKFWQSRMTVGGKVAPVPQLVDLRELAKAVRS
ncbi:hypothetical protein XccvBFoX4_gp81 [Xanthomonas phage FoX4]|uniref:Uncharacterized protein n=1 Tax=Xanthomonas phage FoX4 TaxID=2723900 RepID=A0A858WNE5_9CAUD|nr:hypothetical protein KNU97_gp81 [Xanthomonas phage FoX4]QJI53035.1 hypothetical protein XccvBFoX4_gp81 [Xanthomonas phage FoX4]